MASDLLGRAPCPECGFAHAHIKLKNDKVDAKPYRHCPECGSQYYARNKLQADLLLARVKPTAPPAAPDNPPASTGAPAGPAAKNPPPAAVRPEPEKKYKTVFGVRVPA